LEKVRVARNEEVTYMQGRKLWVLRPTSESFEKTGKAPVSVRWVDTNKGDEVDYDVRCRLVGRDFKGADNKRDDLFAETPPWEAKRMLFSRFMTRRRDGRRRKLMLIDAKKAHLNSKCDEDVYIELPEECNAPEGMCGKLEYWLYGFRPAAAAWEKFYAEKFEEAGFQRGKSCGVVFYHPERDISMAVHGDDFTLVGLEEDLVWIKDLVKQWFEIKVRAIMGHEKKDDRKAVILGRTIEIDGDRFTIEADRKHRQKILEYFDMGEGTRPLSANGMKEEREDGEESPELNREESKVYRGLAARLNFMSQD